MSNAAQRWLSPLLSKLGKRFGFDATYFARNSAFVLLSHGITILKGLVTGYLITRLFPAQMYGEYKFVLSMIGTLSVLSMSGLPRAISRAVAQKRNDIPLRFTMRMHMLICLLGSIGLLCIIPFLGHWHQQDLWPMFIVAAALFVPINVATTFFGGIIIGLGDFGRSFKNSLISGSLVIISVLLMLALRPSSVILLALASGIPAMVYAFHLRGLFKQFPSTSKSWSILRFAMKFTIADIPMTLSWYMDGLLISAFFGMRELAIFSVALLIPEQIKILCKEFLPISFSRQAKAEDSRGQRIRLTKAVIVMTAVFGIGIALYCLITPVIIPFLFPLYDAHVLIPLTNMAAVILLTFPSSLFSQQLEAKGHVRHVLIAQWSAAVVFAIALVVLIPKYGPMGALVSRGLFRLVYASYSAFAVWHVKPDRS